MTTRDEIKLGDLYIENMGDYPPGMTNRDMDHVEGRDIDETDPDDLDWEVVDVDEYLNGEEDDDSWTMRKVNIKAYEHGLTYYGTALEIKELRDIEITDQD